MTLDSLYRDIMAREGGVADVADGKGETRWGQTPGWLLRFHLPSPQSADEALANYIAWGKVTHLAHLCDPPDALAAQLLDWAVHSGEHIPVTTLQRLLGVAADGKVGPKTITAVYLAHRPRVARDLFAKRCTYVGILLKAPGNLRYSGGWLTRLGQMAYYL